MKTFLLTVTLLLTIASIRFFTKPGDGYSFVDSKTPASDGNWAHIGVTFDSVKNKLNFYIDGKLDATHDFPEDLKPSEKPLWIGKHIHLTLGDSQFWDGSLDELGILNVVLDETEITEAMNGLQRFGDVYSSGKLTTTWGILKRMKNDE
ncbi:LamG domain-containing protein [bacterium]|nr:LamG domain-containing protein [bacterium]